MADEQQPDPNPHIEGDCPHCACYWHTDDPEGTLPGAVGTCCECGEVRT